MRGHGGHAAFHPDTLPCSREPHRPYLSPLWRWSVHVPYWLSASCTRVSVSLASGGRLEKHCFSWSCRDKPERRDFQQGAMLRTQSLADTDHMASPSAQSPPTLPSSLLCSEAGPNVWGGHSRDQLSQCAQDTIGGRPVGVKEKQAGMKVSPSPARCPSSGHSLSCPPPPRSHHHHVSNTACAEHLTCPVSTKLSVHHPTELKFHGHPDYNPIFQKRTWRLRPVK